ncbi:MAG: nucleotidyltransferase family protein [archaeon]
MKNNRHIEEIKNKIVPILKKNKVVRAGIFGSYARGEQKKNSDIDILVEIDDKDLSLIGLIGLEIELAKLLGRKIDLIEYPALHSLLKERILKEEVKII